MRSLTRRVSLVALVLAAVLLALTVGSRQVRGDDGDDAQHVRWDIVSQNFPPASPLTTGVPLSWIALSRFTGRLGLD